MNLSIKKNIWIKILPLAILPIISCKSNDQVRETTPAATSNTASSTKAVNAADVAKAQLDSDKLVAAITAADNQGDVANALKTSGNPIDPSDLLKNPDFIAGFLTTAIFADKTSLSVDQVTDGLISQAKAFVTFTQEDSIKVKVKALLTTIADSTTQMISSDVFKDKIAQIAKIAPALFAGGRQSWDEMKLDRNDKQAHTDVRDRWKKSRDMHPSKISKGDNVPLQNVPTQQDMGNNPSIVPATK